MSREIKFRAWDKYNSVMVPSLDMYFFAENGIRAIPKHCGQYEFMQFTGLFDERGCEIYEGDILGLEDPEDHSRALVFFDLGAFRVKLLGILHTPVYDAYWDGWIAIGNIHQNPELLKREV